MDKGSYDAKKIYYKHWRAKNKDKIRQYNKRYWERRSLREQMTDTDSKANQTEPHRGDSHE